MQISPEALLAVTGIRGILSDDPGKITVGDKSKAEMLGRDIRRACRGFVVDSFELKPVAKREAFDYSKVMDELTSAVSMNEQTGQPILRPELLEKIAAAFKPEDHDLASSYLENVLRVVPYLQSILPIRTEVTMAKTLNFDPSDTEIAKFRRAYDIADDPSVILRDMDAGTLVSDQVGHLDICYPRFKALLKTQLGFAMADAMAKKKSWKLPWRKERIVQTIYGEDTFSPELAKDLQASFVAQEQQKPAPPPPRGVSKTASMFQPQTQAVAEGAIGKTAG